MEGCDIFGMLFGFALALILAVLVAFVVGSSYGEARGKLAILSSSKYECIRIDEGQTK